MNHWAAASAIRVRSWPQNITRENFICNAQTWLDTALYNASVDWAAIEERNWQCGIFRTDDIRDPYTNPEEADSIFDHHIVFPTPFASPPMVLVCFNGFDMTGNWNLRTYATNIDHTGFNLSIVKCDDGDPSTKLWSASITWLAIPGEDVLKRRNAWIGQFSTAGRRDIRESGTCHGHVDFGFKFERPPKIFLGLNNFHLRNTANLRLFSETSNVTESGMDWNIWKWDDTILEGASVMFLAVDSR